MQFTITDFSDHDKNIHREWALTNGIGGYAGNSVLGVLNRTHQGLLIASLHPPVERYVVFSDLRETFQPEDGETQYDFYDGSALIRFEYDGTVSFTYRAKDITVKKTIALVHGKNITAVSYEIDNRGKAGFFNITPLMNFREHSENSTVESLQENIKFTQPIRAIEPGFVMRPGREDIQIIFKASEGILSSRRDKKLPVYKENIPLVIEQENEVEGLDTAFMPYDLMIPIDASSRKKISLVCYVLTECTKDSPTPKINLPVPAEFSFLMAAEERKRVEGLIEQSELGGDPFAEPLVAAADQFIAYRESTGLSTVLAGLPWFTDWGRDTMIAFSGLTLATKRFDEARDILRTFAKYIQHGMVPNMFPDDGQEPLYNTADASLWYFYAVYQYLKYVNTPEAWEFVRTEIYPGLTEIMEAYRAGTDFSIYMEENGLLHAGSGLDQVTWMDVRVGEWVVTPRHGCPVEINALWYNALKIMEWITAGLAEDASGYGALAAQTKESFQKEFWNEKKECLYDVIDGDKKDDSIRPNQIYAVSLPFSILPAEKERKVVDLVQRELFIGKGLRSLSRDHRDYHGIYLGSLPKRDAAYHQGTAWGFLIGGFVTAYVKTHSVHPVADGEYPKASPKLREEVLAMLNPLKEYLYENCIGSICEIFDGDEPHKGRGCYAQAWSVGEVLRCYTENIKLV